MWLDLFTANPVVRSLADAGLVQYARRRTRALDKLDVVAVQEQTLLNLIKRAKDTKFGRDHGFAQIRSSAQYQAAVPVREYETMWREYWQPVFPRLEGSTWPDPIPYYALSSGTTSGTTKYIPISREMVLSNRKAALTMMSFFRHAHPEAKLLNGRFFFLGGSTELRLENNGSRSGDLSAISVIEVWKAARAYTFPPLEIANISHWEEKAQKMAEVSAKLPITSISGVPAWILVVFDRLKAVTGKNSIREIWPKLQVIVHGGTKFEPYREIFRKEVGDHVKFSEVYPCSEGFIAAEDPRYKRLRIVPDHGVFFEFIPLSEFDHGVLKTAKPVRHTLANVEIGCEYAVLLTTCAGVWSYLVGDTITFERRDVRLRCLRWRLPIS